MAQEIDRQAPTESTSRPINENRDEEWREEFPYPWDEDEVSTRREEILGSEEFPVDNEGGAECYFMDIAVGIAYVRDVWTNQDVQYALGGLRRGYAFANELRRQLPTPPTVLAEPLDAAEQARQFADIDAVLALGEPITLEQFDALAAEGDELGQALRVRLAEVIAAGI